MKSGKEPGKPEKDDQEVHRTAPGAKHDLHESPVVTEILGQALDSDVLSPPRIRHPIILDALLSAGLLIAAGGFTLCLLQLYVAHTAQQCLIKHDYKSAIALLSSPPIPTRLSSTFGYNPEETLSEALYKDAMSKIEIQGNIIGGVKELEKIPPSSSFFYNAQKIIDEETTPSATTLQGGASVVAAPVPLSSSEKLDYLLQKAEERAQK